MSPGFIDDTLLWHLQACIRHPRHFHVKIAQVQMLAIAIDPNQRNQSLCGALGSVDISM